MFVDALIHPVLRLFVATILEVAVLLHLIDVTENHLEHLVDIQFVEARVAHDLRHDAAVGHREEVERIPEMGSCQFCLVHIAAIRLIDDDAVSNLHDATLDALQFIACTSQLNQQKIIDHRVAGCLALSHSNSLDKDVVIARRLTEDDGLTCLAGHTTQTASCRTGTNERLGMHRQLLHARLVTQDATLGLLGRRVDGQHRQFPSVVLQQMHSKGIDAGGFTSSRYTADADSHGIASIREAFLYHLLSDDLMFGQHALYQRHSLTQHADVSLQYALHILARSE